MATLPNPNPPPDPSPNPKPDPSPPFPPPTKPGRSNSTKPKSLVTSRKGLTGRGAIMIPMEALVKVLRCIDQIEDGLEDTPVDEAATHECQNLGWLDHDLMLTTEGRAVLHSHKER